MNQLTYAVDNLANVKVNSEAAEAGSLTLITLSRHQSWLAPKLFSRQVPLCWRRLTSFRRRSCTVAIILHSEKRRWRFFYCKGFSLAPIVKMIDRNRRFATETKMAVVNTNVNASIAQNF